VAFALGQTLWISAVEENTPTQLVPYLQLLKKDAFGNFRTLMEDVTLSPTMGEYLDMRNNDKADPIRGTRANENYARELMQLFTIGLFQLNTDGTLMLDASGNPYTTRRDPKLRKIYTGWTYPTKPGHAASTTRPNTSPHGRFPINRHLKAAQRPGGSAGGTAESDLSRARRYFQSPECRPVHRQAADRASATGNPSPGMWARNRGVQR
jgi:hypothetical protein